MASAETYLVFRIEGGEPYTVFFFSRLGPLSLIGARLPPGFHAVP